MWTATAFLRRVNANSWPHKLLPPLLLPGQGFFFFHLLVNWGWVDKIGLNIKRLAGDAPWRLTQRVAIYKYKMNYRSILKYSSNWCCCYSCHCYHCRQPDLWWKQIIFYSLNSCKIDKDNTELLEIKTCSVIEGENILTQEGDKAAKEEGDSRTNQTSLDCRSK